MTNAKLHKLAVKWNQDDPNAVADEMMLADPDDVAKLCSIFIETYSKDGAVHEINRLASMMRERGERKRKMLRARLS